MQKSCKPNAMKLASIAEVQLILCKDCANRTQNDKLAWSLCWDAANLMQRLCKSRAESSSLLECYAEPPPILCKHFANECKESFTLNLLSAAKCYAKIVQVKSRIIKLAWMLCRAAANLMQSLCKSNAMKLVSIAEMPPNLCKDIFFLRHLQASRRF